ncbi:hypothetical protein EGW08_007737, partial [Elysia chlorotica]
KLNYRVIDFILDILAGGKSIADCPSFADIGSALENLVSLDDQDGETTTLSPEFQLLLSWCWINLKESCSCLAGITSSSLLFEKKSCLDQTVLHSVGKKFIQVLTTCRHRGAIEGCRSGLYQFSLSLMASDAEELAHIPRVILQEVLESLSGNYLTSSVTRRSAGLPIIVQTILLASCRSGDLILLEATVKDLYSFAIEPLPQEHSQQHDLRQSHALNILKTIFCDASLAPRLMSLLSQVVVLVIEGFDSPSWAIRNAATQLISTLVTRIFGQKSKISSGGSMSLEEFAALHSELLSYICSKLDTYMESSETLVRPSLYVMLTILANIGPMPKRQHSDSRRLFLQRAAEFFLGSPVYSLRNLAAQVWVSLSPLDQAEATLQEILRHLVKNRKLNLLHGWMLCAYKIFSTGHKSSEVSHVLINFCVTNNWLMRGCPSCLLIASLVMQTIQLALGHTGEMTQQLCTELWSLCEHFLVSLTIDTHALQVAKKQCLRDCIKTLHILCKKCTNPDFEIKFQSVLEKILACNDTDLQTEVLECLYEGLKGNSLTLGDNLLSLLWNKMLYSSHSLSFIKTVDILLILRLKKCLIADETNIQVCEAIISEPNYRNTLCLRKAVFELEGISIGMSSNEKLVERMRALTAWCNQEVQFSCPTANESIRLSAASSLRTCGARIIDFCIEHKDLEHVDVCLVSIVKSTLTLLEDTEDDVRQEVSLFISDLCNQAKTHYSIAYLAFSEFISERLFWSSSVCSLLLEFLYRNESISNTVTSAFNSE